MNDKPNKVEMFWRLASQIYDVYQKKNQDYQDSFAQSVDKYGYIAGIVRISDKFSRIENLLLYSKDAKVKDESVIDTLLDLASYSIMLAIEVIDKQKTKI